MRTFKKRTSSIAALLVPTLLLAVALYIRITANKDLYRTALVLVLVSSIVVICYLVISDTEELQKDRRILKRFFGIKERPPASSLSADDPVHVQYKAGADEFMEREIHKNSKVKNSSVYRKDVSYSDPTMH